MAITARSSKKKATAPKPAARRAATTTTKPRTRASQTTQKTDGDKAHAGTYTVPRGHVSLAVPPFWTLRQTNDDIEVESEASETTVVVTAYQRNEGWKALDARDYLTHFLETAPVKGRVQMGENTKRNATLRFRDEEGDNWLVRFISNGRTLLLGTCHSNRTLNSHEGRTGVAVLESIKLKARG